MGIKEKILGLIVENDGLSYENISKKYKEKYNSELNRNSIYKFLQRLKDDKMIIAESLKEKETKNKQYIYNATIKGKNYEINDLEFLKGLFEREAIWIIDEKLTKDDFERLDVI